MNARVVLIFFSALLIIMFFSCQSCELFEDKASVSSIISAIEDLNEINIGDYSKKIAMIDSINNVAEELMKNPDTDPADFPRLAVLKEDLDNLQQDTRFQQLEARHYEVMKESNADAFTQVSNIKAHTENCQRFISNFPNNKNNSKVGVLFTQANQQMLRKIEDLKQQMLAILNAKCSVSFFSGYKVESFGSVIGDVKLMDDGCELFVDCNVGWSTSDGDGEVKKTAVTVFNYAENKLSQNAYSQLQSKFHYKNGELTLKMITMSIDGRYQSFAY
jgi:hypothetical protein